MSNIFHQDSNETSKKQSAFSGAMTEGVLDRGRESASAGHGGGHRRLPVAARKGHAGRSD